MIEIKFKKEFDEKELKMFFTLCPFKDNNTFRVNSFQCRTCNSYIGELKDKQSILCEGDECFRGELNQKIFLTEKSNIEIKYTKIEFIKSLRNRSTIK